MKSFSDNIVETGEIEALKVRLAAAEKSVKLYLLIDVVTTLALVALVFVH